MGELYQKRARELKLRSLASTTQEEYLRRCCHLVRYHMTSPAELGGSAIMEYLEHLRVAGAGPAGLRMNVAALRSLCGVTLDRPKVVERIPWPKVPRLQPEILSGGEVERVLGAVKSPTLVRFTAYGAGLPRRTPALDRIGRRE